MIRPSRALPKMCLACQRRCHRFSIWRGLCERCALVGATAHLVAFMTVEHLRAATPKVIPSALDRSDIEWLESE